MNEAFICDAVRTPIGRYGEPFRRFEPMILLRSQSGLCWKGIPG